MPDVITGPRQVTWHLVHGAHGWLGYAMALLCAGLIVVARIALYPILPTGYPFITLFIGVMMSAWYGGFGPGLATLLWGVIGVWYFLLPPTRSFGPLTNDGATALLINVVNNLLLIGITTAQHASRRRAERSARRESVRAAALEAEVARRETAESALRSVLESTTDAYVGFDARWGLEYANAQAGVVFASLGTPLESLLGRQPWALWPEAAGGELEARLRRVVADRAPATVEYLHQPTGRRLELHAYPTPAGLAVFFRDVTDERRTQQQLTEAQRMDAVGKLAGGVAHEVNNQMTVVLGAASFLLRRPDLPVWAREELGHVREAASRSAAVTSQLLAFGRRQMLRPELVDLNHVVREMETILSRAVGPAVEIDTALSDQPAAVLADKGQIIQALLNLAFNARDAMPDGGRLRIETALAPLGPGNHADNGAEAPPGDYARLSVKDTGTGIEPATLRRVFEPFFTTKPVGQGTGLGLSTVYGIVRQSGGYISAESTPGSGATFTIHLPQATAAAASGTGSVPRLSGAHANLSPIRRGTALVVEDEESVRAMVARVLADQGYDVIEAANGAEALELVDRMGSDGALRLIVTDLAMPVMGGRELARRLGERRRDPVPLLFISGYTDDELVRQNLLEQGQQFLPKPFSPDTLAARVKRLVEG
jgi:two-component system, cell cycle sensor histidine kinase and response regulator CckA